MIPLRRLLALNFSNKASQSRGSCCFHLFPSRSLSELAPQPVSLITRTRSPSYLKPHFFFHQQPYSPYPTVSALLGHCRLQPTTTSTTPSVPMTEGKSLSTSEDLRSRAVESSDVLEYIPWPLSTISTETSSSMSRPDVRLRQAQTQMQD